MSGIFHQYYNIALAPYICALVGDGLERSVAAPRAPGGRGDAGADGRGTAVWSYVLLGRAAGWLPWLRWTILALGVLAAPALLAEPRFSPRTASPRRMSWLVAGLGLAAMVAGPVAYTLNTVATPHSGSIITAGPAVARGGPGGGPGGGGGPQPPQGFPGGNANTGKGNTGSANTGKGNGNTGKNQQQGGPPAQGQGGMPGGTPGQGGPPQGNAQGQGKAQGQGRSKAQGKGKSANGNARPGRGGMGRGGTGGGMGGLLNGSQVSDKAEKLLEKNAGTYTWAGAAVGSQNAASYQLATGKPVMALGGFNGSDPYPTLAGFEKYVKEGKIHYFIGSSGGSGGGPGGGPGSSGTASSISSWVQKHYKKVTVGDAVFYDLTSPKSS